MSDTSLFSVAATSTVPVPTYSNVVAVAGSADVVKVQTADSPPTAGEIAVAVATVPTVVLSAASTKY